MKVWSAWSAGEVPCNNHVRYLYDPVCGSISRLMVCYMCTDSTSLFPVRVVCKLCYHKHVCIWPNEKEIGCLLYPSLDFVCRFISEELYHLCF